MEADSTPLRSLANVNFVSALNRRDLQKYASQMNLRANGQTQDIASRIREEAERRMTNPIEDDWAVIDANGTVDSASMRPNVRLVQSRAKHTSEDSLLCEMAQSVFESGSPSQKQPTADDFSEATRLVLQELQNRTGSHFSSQTLATEPGTTQKGTAISKRNCQQAALGLRFEQAHQKSFERMDSIANHPSVKHRPIVSIDHPLPPLPNANGKRVASDVSARSVATPEVKRPRVTTDTSDGSPKGGQLPVARTHRVVTDTLSSTHIARASTLNRAARIEQRSRSSPRRKGKSPSKGNVSPAKRFIGKAASSLRSFGTLAQPMPPLPSTAAGGRATVAQIASRSMRKASDTGPRQLPGPFASERADEGALSDVEPTRMLSPGLIERPLGASIDSTNNQPMPPLRSASGASIKPRVPSHSSDSRPAISRSDIQSRLLARKHEAVALSKRSSPRRGAGGRSALKISSPAHKSPGKTRSSLSRAMMS